MKQNLRIFDVFHVILVIYTEGVPRDFVDTNFTNDTNLLVNFYDSKCKVWRSFYIAVKDFVKIVNSILLDS